MGECRGRLSMTRQLYRVTHSCHNHRTSIEAFVQTRKCEAQKPWRGSRAEKARRRDCNPSRREKTKRPALLRSLFRNSKSKAGRLAKKRGGFYMIKDPQPSCCDALRTAPGLGAVDVVQGRAVLRAEVAAGQHFLAQAGEAVHLLRPKKIRKEGETTRFLP